MRYSVKFRQKRKLYFLVDYFKIVRYFLYTVGIIIFYALDRVPDSLVYFFIGARPVYLVPLVLVITTLEEKRVGFIFSIIVGILLDLDFNYKLGFFTITLPIASLVLNIVITRKENRKSFLDVFFIFLFVFCIFSLEFLLFCILKGHKEILFELLNFYLPKLLYTSLTIPLFYLFNKTIFLFFSKKSRVENGSSE